VVDAACDVGATGVEFDGDTNISGCPADRKESGRQVQGHGLTVRPVPERYADLTMRRPVRQLVVVYPSETVVADPSLPYVVTLGLDLTGRPSVEWLRCERWDDGPEVGSLGLRTIPVRRLLAAAVHAVDVQTASAEPPGRTRVALTDDHLAEVAEIYRSNVDYAPVAAVARHWGKPHGTARRWVALGRARGLIRP
jgi:hypothetical protein